MFTIPSVVSVCTQCTPPIQIQHSIISNQCSHNNYNTPFRHLHDNIPHCDKHRKHPARSCRCEFIKSTLPTAEPVLLAAATHVPTLIMIIPAAAISDCDLISPIMSTASPQTINSRSRGSDCAAGFMCFFKDMPANRPIRSIISCG